jgi:alpha-tubulin suppressor-like RCC1 family protein
MLPLAKQFAVGESMNIRRALALAVLAAVSGLVACDEEDITGPGFICDVTNPVRDIILTPSNAQVLVHVPALSTDTVLVSAVATGRLGTARNDVRFKFTSSDPSIATVDSLGVVRAVRAGTVRITAEACGESSTAQINILNNIATVLIIPGSDTLVAGDSIRFKARAFGQDGLQILGVKFTFSSTNPGVVVTRLTDSTATITTPLTPGTVTIGAVGEGVSASASLLLLPRVFITGTLLQSSLDVGDATGCGIISAGQAFCWGLNNYGQLGASGDSVCFESVVATIIEDDSVVTTAKPCSLIPLRISHTLDFSSVSAGDSASCGITIAGRAYCWGSNTRGTLGNGTTSDTDEPALVTSALTFTSISVGGAHACGLATGGLAYCWGADSLGQLGDSRVVNSTTPIPVSGGGGTAVFASISAGFRHTCGVTSAGTAFCWGSNERGQLGAGTTGGFTDTPVQVLGGLTFASISAGGDHTCGVTTGGAAYCWGSNFDGQLGNGATGGFSATPSPVAGGLSFSRISASTGTRSTDAENSPLKITGAGHTCGLTTNGAVYCWGDNENLQLGRGPFSGGPAGASGTPQQVTGGELPGGLAFTSISAGSVHSCGVTTDGAAYCWGSNIFGALGNTFQAAFRGLPQKVSTPR